MESPEAETRTERAFGLELAERDVVASAAAAFAGVLPQSEHAQQYTRIAEAAKGRHAIQAAAADAGRAMDPEHFGVIIRYARGALPASVVRQVASRRPGLEPTAIVPSGLSAVCTRIEEFIQVGFSKFVLVPAEEPADWARELEDVAQAALANFQALDARAG